ncbi:MAG: hypothetical protein QM532_02585 [Cyanobium sp. MAG06]|nr:hypothetical protein [Cyanobium sp. MAG06]
MKNILIKASGDVTYYQKFFDFVLNKATNEIKIVVICGGGTKISASLASAGYEIAYDNLNRRITKTNEEREIMKLVLEEERSLLEEKFTGRNISVIIPVLYVDSIMCPINGDDMVKAYSLGFEEIYVVTLIDRVAKKEKDFIEYKNVTVIGI